MPAVETVRVSPAKKLPTLTVAKTRLTLSGSLSLADEISPIEGLFDDAGLSELSVKVAPALAVIDSVGS